MHTPVSAHSHKALSGTVRKFSINKSLSKKDVVKEYMRISNRVNKVFKVDRPSEMIRKVKQRMVLKPACKEDISLDV